MYRGNEEPTIEELLSDPIASLVMARDRLRPDQIWAFIRAARHRRDAREQWVCKAVPEPVSAQGEQQPDAADDGDCKRPGSDDIRPRCDGADLEKDVERSATAIGSQSELLVPHGSLHLSLPPALHP